uniref:SHSP domain-containing protein n=1 Tax=Oreochromis aureus TaxID=47969 RepID=A0A668SGD1_OREAU
MSEQAKTDTSCGEYSRGAPWYPLRKWWHLSQLFSQDAGLPSFLESGDARWMDVDWLQRSLAACSWPGYIPAPLFVPYISGSMHHPSQTISKWRVIMDAAHFTPSEISLSIRDGFLEVRGKHEERPDEHGFIARCFTRKYRLPVEMDATKITSTFSVDGFLSVEAPVPETSVPATIPIPIKVQSQELEAANIQQEITE